jgi:GNAT superfamily N-acetyltransferase
VTVAADFHVRRVGFRTGTDEELTALYAVEAPIAAERGSNRMPQPAASYMAFARKLPSQFNDHALLVEAADGTPVAAGFCWSNSAGDHRVMECDVFVRRDHRHQGIGSRLLASICNETVNGGRSLLIWSTFGAVPAGAAFSRRVGARIAGVNRTSELVLTESAFVPASANGARLLLTLEPLQIRARWSPRACLAAGVHPDREPDLVHACTAAEHVRCRDVDIESWRPTPKLIRTLLLSARSPSSWMPTVLALQLR